MRLTTEAEGRASAIRTQGEAEAAMIFQKGEAEAKAMNVKAEAYQDWNQAAVVDRLISNMADVVRAMAEPLSKVDKITIVSTGNDGAAGANKLTGDITKIAAQVPALFEALSGMDMRELMSNVKGMRARPQRQCDDRRQRNDNQGGGLGGSPPADFLRSKEECYGTARTCGNTVTREYQRSDR